MVQEGLEAAPELRLSESQIRAQERQLTADKRAFWLPTFALRANVATVDRSGVGSDATTIDVGGGQTVTLPQDNDWSWEVGASASLPLFTGFGRMARVNRSRETLAQLQFEREATAERIATRIRTSLYQSGASFANIDLAREAARAATATTNWSWMVTAKGWCPFWMCSMPRPKRSMPTSMPPTRCISI